MLGATIILHQKTPQSRTNYIADSEWEKVVCVFSIGPLDCQTAKADSETALQTAAYRFPGQTLRNNEADAFRHCFWSALMTLHIGVSQAKIVGDNHEKYGNNPAAEQNMDLFNNAVGLQVGLSVNEPKAAEDTCYEYAVTRRLLVSP